jgi:hypothetical protein
MKRACTASLLALGMFWWSGAADAQQRPATWRLTPELRIGSESHGPRYQFTRILGVVPLPGGSVYVADAGFTDISLFDSAGVHIRTIGREGSGPGEFRRLTNIGLLGDTLWALDNTARRASLFAPDGTVLATISNNTSREAADRWNVHLTALLPGGHAFGGAAAGMEADASRDREPVLLLARNGSTLDTLAWLATRNKVSLFRTGSGLSMILQPFSDADLVVPEPAGARVFIVDRSAATSPRGATFTVPSISATGDTLWTAAVAYAPVRTPRDSANAFVARLLRGNRSGIPDAEIRRMAFTPEYLTPVSSGVPGMNGTLWLRRDDRPSAPEYWIVGPRGLVASVRVPANATLMAVAGDAVWTVEKDTYDVPSVVRYRLHRE